MEETIKGIEVIAYKGMDFNMTCRDFKYELEKTYKTDKAKLYECGFHACLNPIDALDYYLEEEGSRYFKVLLSGEIAKCDNLDTNVAATEITILEEMTDYEILNIAEWWKNDNVLDLLYFSDGFARVQREDRLYNFIDKNGNYLFTKWFYWLGNFKEGFARVARTNGEWNFIDKQGNYLFNEWFNYLEDFNEGLAKVRRSDGLYNFIDKQGNILSNEWFIDADYFVDGVARVRREDYLYNFIDRQGNILFNEWFNYVGKFHDGFGEVQRTNGEWAKIDKTGNLIKILQ